MVSLNKDSHHWTIFYHVWFDCALSRL